MYTEYVFENKKYEVANREIKATLFDIVAQEEEKIGDLREKAFVEDHEASVASELQALYVQQDSFLREILAISDKLTKALQRVDSCSKKLKQIEAKTSAQTIVRENIARTVKNAASERQQEVVKEEPVMVAPPVEEKQAAPVETRIETDSEPVMAFDDEAYAEKQAKKEAAEAEKKMAEEEQTPVVEETELLEPVIAPTEAPVENVSEPLIVPTEEPVMVAEAEQPLITPITEEQPVVAEAQEGQPLITPVIEEQPVINEVQEEQPLITPVVEEQPTIEVVEEKEEEPVKSDGDVLIPISMDVEKDENEEKLVFKKRTDDAPKVIMISGKQAKNLKGSLPTQEALLSAKGFFKKDESLEKELVDNGLLEPDVSSKQEQLEKMMNQANELYAAGKVDEAQSIMNEVSTLNQELQEESAGISK